MTASIHSPLSYARTSNPIQLPPPLKKRNNRLPYKSHFSGEGKSLIQAGHKRKIRFYPFASVSIIPNRMDYTESERENMWTSEEDQFRDKQRNAVEFAYENGDWRQVKEEKDFIRIRGEWIHPVHVNNAFRRLQIRLALTEYSKQI